MLKLISIFGHVRVLSLNFTIMAGSKFDKISSNWIFHGHRHLLGYHPRLKKRRHFFEVWYGNQAVGTSESHEISHMRRRYLVLALLRIAERAGNEVALHLIVSRHVIRAKSKLMTCNLRFSRSIKRRGLTGPSKILLTNARVWISSR